MAGQGGTPRKHQFDDDFMLYAYKINLCPRLDHHNWKHCAFRHTGETAAQRRHPSCYKPTFCANLKMYGSCAAGDACTFSHNTFEMSLHPERYKTTLCNLGEKCNREICFFAHSTRDLRAPTPALAPGVALGDGQQLLAAGGMPGPAYVATGGGGGLQWAPAGAYGGSAIAMQQGMQVYGMVTPSLAPAAPHGAVYLLPAGMQQLPQAPQPGQQEVLQQLLREAESQLGRSQGPTAAPPQQQQMMQPAAAQQLSGLMAQQLNLGESSTTPSASPQAVLAATSGPPGYESSPVMAFLSGGGAAGVPQSPLPPMLRQELQAGGGGGSFTSQCSSSSHVSGAGVRSLPLTPWIDSHAGAGPPGLNSSAGGGGGGNDALLACPASSLHGGHVVPMTLAPLTGAYSSAGGGYEMMQPGAHGGVELLSVLAAPGTVYQLVQLPQPHQQPHQ